jgi:hypothetical protein
LGFRLRKSQVAMEFIMLVLLAFMIMIVFTVVGRDSMVDLRKEEEFVALKDVALAVQSEIFTATNVEDGYTREFGLPASLNGINYTIQISGGYVIAESENHEHALKISPVTGDVTKGANVIRKEGGIVYLNQ